MKIVFFGTPHFAVPSLDRLLEGSDFEVLGVVTQPDKRRGRGSAVSFSPVKERAVEQNLPLWQPQRLKKDPETLAQLRAMQADIFAVVAYGQLLSPELLAMPRLGCVNVHGSLLPRYRGAAPIQWSLYNGDEETGITTMLMDVGMDTGDMLLKSTTPIGLLDNAQDLSDRLAQQGAELLGETLLHWTDLQPTPQAADQATYAPLIQKEDYVLHWERSAWALHNQIRGFYPQCQTQFRDKPLKISASFPLGLEPAPPCPEPFAGLAAQWTAPQMDTPPVPGTIVAVIKHQGPVIQTGEGYLLLTQVQPAGKRSLSGWDFVNGSRVGVGDRLG
ncbi:MAG: methionyl-tRNA formyltransferase [Prochlorotrichaceae cyanobacterium]